MCWEGGAYSLAGKDPYTVTGFLPPRDKEPAFVYPPFTLPLFRLFALISFENAAYSWTAFNVLVGCALGLAARRVLIAQDGERSQIVAPWLAVLLTGPVLLSLGGRFCLEMGQFSLLVTVALLGALAAQAARPSRPLAAAACLAAASIKVQTMAPFLLLFLRRSDFRTLLCLGLFMAALLLGAGNPAELPGLLRTFITVQVEGRQPGHAGDASVHNSMSHTAIGFDHAFNRLGIADPAVYAPLNFLCIAALTVWLGYLATRRPEIPRGALGALVSLYSMLFLYHRLYDLVILIIPVIYCASRFRAVSGWARWLHAWVLVAILLALNVPYGEFHRLQRVYASHPVLSALVLPSATYLILSALAALAGAVFLELRRGPCRDAAESSARYGAAEPPVELG
jgi:hypothetical protein